MVIKALESYLSEMSEMMDLISYLKIFLFFLNLSSTMIFCTLLSWQRLLKIFDTAQCDSSEKALQSLIRLTKMSLPTILFPFNAMISFIAWIEFIPAAPRKSLFKKVHLLHLAWQQTSRPE